MSDSAALDICDQMCSSEFDRNSGFGTRLVQAAVARMPTDKAIFASVAPGNTRSLRCLLRAGFLPIGAECVLSSTLPR